MIRRKRKEREESWSGLDENGRPKFQSPISKQSKMAQPKNPFFKQRSRKPVFEGYKEHRLRDIQDKKETELR